MIVECICLFIIFKIVNLIYSSLQLSNLQCFGISIFAAGVSTILSNYIYYTALPKIQLIWSKRKGKENGFRNWHFTFNSNHMNHNYASRNNNFDYDLIESDDIWM